MIKGLRSLALLLVLPLTAVPAWAAKKTSKSHKTSTKKSSKAAAKPAPGKPKGDMEARALLRKKAPFYLDQRFRGEITRINKDGSFSKEGELGDSNQGSWRVKQGKLMLKYSTGEEFGYRITFSGTTPVVNGQRASKANHYVLNGAD